MVVGVPESGIDAAIGYSEESGIPYEKAIVKNSYIGRTFIKPSQKERMKSVKIKLNPIADKIKGKRVVIIDDSIVRGTTVDRIVTMLKEAGAKEVLTFRQEENLLPATIQSKKSQSSARLIPSDISLLSHFVR